MKAVSFTLVRLVTVRVRCSPLFNRDWDPKSSRVLSREMACRRSVPWNSACHPSADSDDGAGSAPGPSQLASWRAAC